MDKSDKNYTATPEDVEFVKEWIDKFEESCFPKYKVEEVKDLEKFREAQEIYLPKSYVGIDDPVTFYQSKYFTFFLETDKKCPSTPLLKVFNSEKEFQKFIKNGRYLIYRCFIGQNPIKDNRGFAVYYHYDFGKIGWLQNKLQFIINKWDLPKELIVWFYGLKKIPRPKLDIKLRFKD
jgi:hypothetical protein